jgi:hypothetical protein
MLWIKRNLFLVMGILVALALLGGAIFYLITKYNEADELQTKFDEVKAEFQKYQEMQPTPNKPNIKLAGEDTTRLTAFAAEVTKMFKAPQYTKMDDPTFLSLLFNTLSELNKGASNAAVAIPEKYKFTFTVQSTKTRLASNSVPNLYMELMEIKSLCNILYQSKIVALESIKRPPVSTDDVPLTGPDYIDRRITTNQFGVIVPYEVTFRCFSTELGNLLNTFANTEEFFLIKNLLVQGEPPTMAMSTPPATPETPNPPTAAAKKGAKPLPVKTVLDEKAVRVTMQIDLMRPLPVAQAPKPAAPGAATQPGPATQTPPQPAAQPTQ